MKNVVLSTVLLLNLACFAQVEKPKMEERKAKMEKQALQEKLETE